MGLDGIGMVFVCHRSSKNTFGANNAHEKVHQIMFSVLDEACLRNKAKKVGKRLRLL